MHCKTLNEVQQMAFLYKGNTILRTYPQHQGHPTITIENENHPEHASTKNAQTSSHLPWFNRILHKVYQEFCENSQNINTPNTCQQVKFNWTLVDPDTFLTLKESIIQAPIQ